MPYELESPDLQTLGTTDADGALKDTDPYFGAHYRITTDAGGLDVLCGHALVGRAGWLPCPALSLSLISLCFYSFIRAGSSSCAHYPVVQMESGR